MKKALEIFVALFIIVVLAVSILTMPWPVSVVIGVMTFVSFSVIYIHDRLVKKRTREKEQVENAEGTEENL